MTSHLHRPQKPQKQVTPLYWREWPLDLTDQYLTLMQCTNPSPADIAACGANLLSAAIHITDWLGKNPTAIDEAEYDKASKSAAALLRCAYKMGWRDEPNSIMRSIWGTDDRAAIQRIIDGDDPQGDHGSTDADK